MPNATGRFTCCASQPSEKLIITCSSVEITPKADWVRLLSRRYAQDFAPLAEKYGVIGTAEQCAEKIERFREAGCTYFILDTIVDPEQQQEHLELIAAEILPRFVPR